ncbi:hypothetical protein C8Q76DRAFT_719497 [Earliella scabrosa]|nr:hypothetical protein C8Q76DRAFT_719497 [Earliella scabrosa]
MAFLLTLVAGLVLVGVADRSASIGHGRTRSCETVPGHMVRPSAAVTLDRRKSGGVESPSRRGSTGGESSASAVGAGAREVPKATTVVALLAGVLQPEAGTLGLDVAHTAARVALLGGDRAGLRARRGLMAGLAAVVAETLLGGAVFCDVPHCRSYGLRRVEWRGSGGHTHSCRT